MTPQERQLVADLFDRLARLEGTPRDPDAEAVMAEGLRRAPNAVYALVQTALLQDEALKRANARIQELEAELGMASSQEQPRERGFLDSMRDTLFGERERPRTSVPPTGDRAMGLPSGYRGAEERPVWGGGAQPGPGYGPGMQPGMQQPGSMGMQRGGFGGGSFLGTAAAAAAGVIGGSLLLDGIRSAWGNAPHDSKTSAFDADAGGAGKGPWGGESSGGSNDLAQQAGLGDIGRGDHGGGAGEQQYGMLDNGQDHGGDDFDQDFDDSDVA